MTEDEMVTKARSIAKHILHRINSGRCSGTDIFNFVDLVIGAAVIKAKLEIKAENERKSDQYKETE